MQMGRPPGVTPDCPQQCSGRTITWYLIRRGHPCLDLKFTPFISNHAGAKVPWSLGLRNIEMRIGALSVRLPDIEHCAAQRFAIDRSDAAGQQQNVAWLLWPLRQHTWRL